MYRLNRLDASVVRLADGAVIPADPRNADWRTYQDWLAQGNQPDPAQTPAELTARLFAELRSRRDLLLVETEWLVTRHREQVELGRATSLDGPTYQALLVYRQALRDLPAVTADPAQVVWPQPPL
jgi:hypothetical protein